MRKTRYDIDTFFLERYSPRQFISAEVEDEDFEAILEAGSTAPSCYNEQPWRFVLGPKERFLSILSPGNGEWCQALERFILLCSEPEYVHNRKPNAWASFDCGTAWGYMTMEAHRRGIAMHAMAGYDRDKAIVEFQLGRLRPEAVIVLGVAPSADEFTSRRPLEELIVRRG